MDRTNTALLVVDVQNAIVNGSLYKMDQVLENIQTIISECREKGIEVIYIQHTEIDDDHFRLGSHGWKIHDSIKPRPHEQVIRKHYNSAFKDTPLKTYLELLGFSQLIIIGLQTEYCIDATIKAAFEYGYHLTIPEDTNTTCGDETISGEALVNYLNKKVYKGRFGLMPTVQELIYSLK